MIEAPFTISGAIKEGWRLTKENIGFLIVYQIILYIIFILTSGTQTKWEWSFWHFLGWIILILGKMGFYHSVLLITDGIKPRLSELYQNWRMLLSWVVSSFLFAIMLTLGLALFIVPGLYIWARYGFYPFSILDKENGPFEAFHESAKITKGIRWPIFLLFLSCLGLNLVGLLFFGIGLLISVPVTLLALAFVYRQLTPLSIQKPSY